MSTTKNIGLIECGNPTSSYQIHHLKNAEGYTIKKVKTTAKAAAGFAQLQYPGAEIVQDKNDIIQDSTIDLVIVSAPRSADLPMVKEMLQAGKNVQLLDQH